MPEKLEIPITGMDCADCARHVRGAIAGLPGVHDVDVFLGSEKAVVFLDPALVRLSDIRTAVEGVGYGVGAIEDEQETPPPRPPLAGFARRILTLLGLAFGVVLLVVVAGEWLGLFERLTARVPFLLGLLIVLIAGAPLFYNVIRSALRGQIISHMLMTLGVIAALAVGQWTTAAIVVLFMYVGEYVEHFTTAGARRAVRDLTALAPQTARVEREGAEVEVPVGEVQPGETVIVRPGEQIPVDGEVVSGQATVDQSAITGESMPVEAGPGTPVLAATIARLGSLRVRVARVGQDTTFGRVIRLVEEAEANRAGVQRFADRFTAYYLPVVLAIAALTYLLRRDPLATAAVLVVVCSCSVALATPIAMLAAIGSAARRGLLIKGGKYLEQLARADVLLLDKTGTLTLGRPRITDVIPLDDGTEQGLLHLAASAERYSEHPLADALREEARARGGALSEPGDFSARPGLGVEAVVGGRRVTVGSQRLIQEKVQAGARRSQEDASDRQAPGTKQSLRPAWHGTTLQQATTEEGRAGARRSQEMEAAALEAQGKTLLFVAVDGQLAGVLAAADTPRAGVAEALAAARELGIRHVELLTGDNERTAAALAGELGVPYRANLLPEDKIAIVRQYQAAGHTVIMVGDGVNDAPALSQADAGIAMGAAGSDVAIEAAHVALMREDWALVPEVLRTAQRAMRVVKLNLGFTAVYNVVGLTLAALGILPPALAAAAQSLPDLGILANSSRLLRVRKG